MAPGGLRSELTDHVMEMLAPLGAVEANHFFGGIGIRHDAILFAMIMDETLYFRVDAESRPRYEAAGSEAFSYETRNGSRAIEGFFTVPEELFDEPEDLRAWARTAIAVATRAKAKKRPAKRKG
jgi:DNA transformation protein and related proteins